MYTLQRKNKENIVINDLNLYEYTGAEIKDKIELLPKLEFALLLAKSGLKATELVALIFEKKEYYNLTIEDLNNQLNKVNTQINSDKDNGVLKTQKEEILLILDIKILEKELKELKEFYLENKKKLTKVKAKKTQENIEKSEGLLDLYKDKLNKFYVNSKIAEINLDIQLRENEKTKEIKKDIRETKAELIELIKKEFGIEDRLTLDEQDELIKAIAEFNNIEKKTIG